jgi:hypothetical protein
MPESADDSDPDAPRDPDALRLTSLLADLRFPARKWELTTYAEDRGADGTSRRELAGLPEGLYRDLDAVVSMVSAAKQAASRHTAATSVSPKSVPSPRADADRRRQTTRSD